jgi:hypothetical protein
MFIVPMIRVTFLCPNKKVTKEIVRGEALRANRILAPDPTPAATTTAR